MMIWAWSCWPFVNSLALVRDCKMEPHCNEVRMKPFCGDWVTVGVACRDRLRRVGLWPR